MTTPKKISPDTTFQFNIDLKTLIIIIGFIIACVTGAWLDLKLRIGSSSDDRKDEIIKLDRDIDDIKKGINQIKDVDIQSVSDRVNLVDGKVQGLIIILQSGVSNNVRATNNHPTAITEPSTPINPTTSR